MTFDAKNLIGSTARRGAGPAFRAFNPSKSTEIEPEFRSASVEDVDQACGLAEQAKTDFRNLTAETRARFLDAIATNLEAAKDSIIARAKLETGLPEARLNNELGRTTNQLRMFGRVIRDGHCFDVRIDEAIPDRVPPRPDLRLTHIAVGPVAVFGASNFPLAFSVAGGDTASAFAAGCPVLVKAHSAHPGTSAIVGAAIQSAVKDGGLPKGIFSLLFDAGFEIGAALVADPRVQAVGFTGSRRGGLSLQKIAQKRPAPIPVYAEMSSINPVILMPGALAERGMAIGAAFADAVSLGAGQFCTNPGLLIALDSTGLDSFISGAKARLEATAAATMLTPAIHRAYLNGVEKVATTAGVEPLARGGSGSAHACEARLWQVSGQEFLKNEGLQDEVFGASSLLVRCGDMATVIRVLKSIGGQLTIALHATDNDLESVSGLLPLIEDKAGRIIFNGFGTGVEVSHAMVHGGPYPATTDARTTSVGSLAINRFLRPICYQDAPQSLLPPILAERSASSVPRMVNGKRKAVQQEVWASGNHE